MFLAIISRPDIAFAVNSVSRFLNRHNVSHWNAVKRIFAYLLSTKNYGIQYKNSGSESSLIGYSDADFAGDVETRRSTSGYLFSLAHGPVTWLSQRQSLVTTSTTEAEYVAGATAARELIWLQYLMSDILEKQIVGTVLFIDNESAVKLTKNPEYHKRTKHIDIRHHFLREKNLSGELTVVLIKTEFQKADIFTKALSRDRFRYLCESIGMISY